MISLYKKQGIKNMLSDELNKISNVILASKLTNFLKPQCDQYLIKQIFNKPNWQSLTDEQKKQLTTKTSKTVETVENNLREIANVLGIKNFNKQFIVQIKKLIDNANNNIFEEHTLVSCKALMQDFIKYKQFIDPQQRNIERFESLSDISQIVLKYKQQQQQNEKSISQFKKVMTYGDYIVIQWNDEDQQNAINWLKPGKKTNWCVINWGYWKNYKRPYFLILKQYKPYMLVNVPTCQFKDIYDAPIKKEAVDSNIIKITKEIFHRYYNDNYWDNKVAYGDDFSPIKPYYPTQAIIEGIDKNRINTRELEEIITNTIKTQNEQMVSKLMDVLKEKGKDVKEFLKNVSNQKQYRMIAKKLFPNENGEKEDEWLKNSVQLKREDLIKMIFNAFSSGKSGLPLFRRLIKFHATEENINIFVQGDAINDQLINVSYKGKTLFDNITALNQLKQLNDIYKETNGTDLQLNNQQAKTIYNNACSQKSPDLPTINFLLDRKLVEINSQTLFETLKSGKDKIIEILLNKGDNNLFNQPLYDDMLPIFYCVKQKKPRLLNLLIQSNKVDIAATAANGKDVVWYALQLNDKQAIKTLIEHGKGIDFNKVYPVGTCANNSLFSYCVTKDDKEMIDLLLKNNNVDVNIKSPIDNAIANNDTNMVNKIISHITFNPYSKNDNGDAPIMVAIMADRTFSMFKLLADKMGKANLSKSDLTNPKNKMTPLMLAVDNDMPYEIIIKYFDNKSISYSNKGSKNVYDIITTKLSIKPNDENMLKIKKWVQQQNKTKTKKKQIDLQTQLMTFVNRGNEDAFKQLLEENPQGFDFSKKINGYNIVNLLAIKPTASKYLKLLLQFIDNSNKYKSQLKGLLQQFDYSDASQSSKVILKPYYEQAKIKISSTNFKKILAFVEKFLS